MKTILFLTVIATSLSAKPAEAEVNFFCGVPLYVKKCEPKENCGPSPLYLASNGDGRIHYLWAAVNHPKITSLLEYAMNHGKTVCMYRTTKSHDGGDYTYWIPLESRITSDKVTTENLPSNYGSESR